MNKFPGNLLSWKDSRTTPVIDHAISRAVDRRLVLNRDEKEHFRKLMRMHDLSEFMNGLLKRFTRWFNRRHERTGTLWEDRFKSVIVENGFPARTVAAYIDLNPVRPVCCGRCVTCGICGKIRSGPIDC